METRYRWVFPSPVTVGAAFRSSAERLGLSGRLMELLAARGLDTSADLESFFAPTGAGLHDPRLLPDAEVFLDRIRQARDAGERLLLFGDFDADGLTGLAILATTLRHLGLTVDL